MADAKPMADGSLRFKLRGGPVDGMVVRLFPHNNGFDSVLLDGVKYIAPEVQDIKKPYMYAQL